MVLHHSMLWLHGPRHPDGGESEPLANRSQTHILLSKRTVAPLCPIRSLGELQVLEEARSPSWMAIAHVEPSNWQISLQFRLILSLLWLDADV